MAHSTPLTVQPAQEAQCRGTLANRPLNKNELFAPHFNVS